MEDGGHSKWDRSKGKALKIQEEIPVAKEEIPPGYEEYLLLLQQRNRLLRKLKKKDEQQIELEKKEQGFSLYVNGANTELGQGASRGKSRSSSRHSKTAGDAYGERKKQLYQELEFLEKETGDHQAQTAPDETASTRKEWKTDFVQIKVEGGRKMKLKAPGKLSGKYSEDFESVVVDSESESGSDAEHNEVSSEDQDDAEEMLFSGVGDSDSEDENELTLSFNDVQTLRKSLEADQDIRKSIQAAKMRIEAENKSGKTVDIDDDDDDDDDDDEIDEELEVANDSLNLLDNAVLEKLPCLASYSVPNTREDCFSPARPDTQGKSESRADQSANKAVKGSSGSDETRKAVVPDQRAEDDVVVLRFSTPAKKKQRVLSATRRKESTEDNTSFFGNPQLPVVSQSEQKGHDRAKGTEWSQEKEFTFTSDKSSKKSRPLSATRKSKEKNCTDRNAEEVFKAMAKENETIETAASGSRTAPEKSQDFPVSPLPQERERPSSISTFSPTTENTIALVTEKVRKMDARQQHHLIEMLSKLELKGAPFKGAGSSPSPGPTPIKATVPFSPSPQPSVPLTAEDHSSEKIETSRDFSVMDSHDDAVEHLDVIEVNIEILSNWGHPTTVGLTEIQFFDMDGCLVQNDSRHVHVSGQTGDEGPFGNLSNGKTKTSKGRYMWTCQFRSGRPVELGFHLPAASEHQGLSKICIWNYNRGLKELNIGVKDARIFIGGELVWEGAVEKGCGNQVFDYSKVIHLVKQEEESTEHVEGHVAQEQPIIRSETVTLRRSIEDDQMQRSETVVLRQSSQMEMGDSTDDSTSIKSNKKLPILPVPPSSKPPQRLHSPKSLRQRTSSHGKASQSQPQSPEPIQDRMKDNVLDSLLGEKHLVPSAEGKLVARSSSTPNLPTSVCRQDSGSESLRGDSAAGALPSKPPWLNSGSKKEQRSSSRSSSRSKSRPIWLEDEAGTAAQDQISDKRDSHVFSPTENKPTKTRPSSGRRSASADRKLDRSGDGHLEDSRASGEEDSSKKHDAQSARAQWRTEQNLSLEESWSVLSLFEKSNKGRITDGLDLGNHGDSLDELLNYKQEDQTDRGHEPVEDSSSSVIDLEIPTLPKGQELIINIKSTWGDRYYVGLNGIEVFTEQGKPAEITKITADPSDINVLPEYGNDPRVVTNLIDGVFRTRDDMHLWLAPFTSKGNHFITITFEGCAKIAMIRVWNYNKSRIHSSRGARDVEITLDGSLIFQGEIARASGGLGADEAFGDTILFTMDEPILEAMAQYDETYEGEEEDTDELMLSTHLGRPSTADRGHDTQDGGERPLTCARQHKKTPEVEHQSSVDSNEGIIADGFLSGKVLQLNFLSTWGDQHYLGLTGIELLGPGLEAVPLTDNMLQACPRDLNDLPDYDDDDRTLDKIIDKVNVTMSDEHMWLIPFTEGEDHLLTIDLGQKTQLMGLRVWNYNKNPDDTFRGAKQVYVKLDGRTVSPSEGYLLRKGPGNVHFDFAQDIYFSKAEKGDREERRRGITESEQNRRPESRVNLKKLMPDYEPTLMPYGFVFQFQLFSSWGDPYYVGLNGIEFYDESGYRIHLTEDNITAYPHSVNVLDGVSDDVRTPDKLIDGNNDTNDGRHMWLAPVLPGLINLIYVVFDEPVIVSMIKVWNYSKTPIRGVQQFGLLVDDLLVYHGTLPQVPTVSRGILPNLEMPIPHHTILFTDREQIALAEKKNLVSSKEGEQDVQLTNDKRIMSHFSDQQTSGKGADPALRPKTSVKAMALTKRR